MQIQVSRAVELEGCCAVDFAHGNAQVPLVGVDVVQAVVRGEDGYGGKGRTVLEDNGKSLWLGLGGCRERGGGRSRACCGPFVVCDHSMPRRLDDGRRRRLNKQGWLLNEKNRLGRVGVRGAGVVGQVCVAESVGRDGPGAAETVATPGEAKPGPAAALGAGIVRRTHSKERKQAEQDRPPHGPALVRRTLTPGPALVNPVVAGLSPHFSRGLRKSACRRLGDSPRCFCAILSSVSIRSSFRCNATEDRKIEGSGYCLPSIRLLNRCY